MAVTLAEVADYWERNGWLPPNPDPPIDAGILFARREAIVISLRDLDFLTATAYDATNDALRAAARLPGVEILEIRDPPSIVISIIPAVPVITTLPA